MATYIQLPLTIMGDPKDPSKTTIEAPNADPALAAHLRDLNALVKELRTVPSGVPPPPVPVNPQRSAAIEKMRAAGNAAFRKGAHADAVNMYAHAISMALTRPTWEPAPLLKEEVQVLFLNRSQAHMSLQDYPEALADANISVDFKPVGNHKAHYRKAKVLKEMGRLEEAKAALEFGLEFGPEAELQALLKEVNADIAARKAVV